MVTAIPRMTTVFAIHCAATWAFVGLIWTVQLVTYPQFSRVGREEFAPYHAAHMSGIILVVGPLLFVEGVTAAWLLFFAGWRDGISDEIA